LGTYTTTFVYQGRFKKDSCSGYRVSNEVVLGTSVNKLENGTLWRMCPLTLARRYARDRASEVSETLVLRETSEVAELALLKPL
jgi:hypothetical protein